MTGRRWRKEAWRRVRIILWCVVGLAVATGVTLGLGHAVYLLRGKPNNYAVVYRTSQARTFVFMAAPQAGSSRLVARLGIDLTEEALLAEVARSGPWEKHPSGGGALRFRDSAHAIYDIDADGIVRQVRIICPHAQATSIQHVVARLNRIWGPPTAAVAPVSTNPPADAISFWDTAAGQILIDARESEFDGEYTLHIVLTSEEHPLARARRETGGLARHHPHAEELREALAEIDRGTKSKPFEEQSRPPPKTNAGQVNRVTREQMEAIRRGAGRRTPVERPSRVETPMERGGTEE